MLKKPPQKPTRLPNVPKAPFVDKLIAAAAICSGIMLGLAVPELIGAATSLQYAKAILIAIAGMVVAFGVTKLAVDKGAPLAAANISGSVITSVLSILIVGSGLFAATYAGLTRERTDQLRLAEHGEHLTQFVNDRNEIVSNAGQIGPAIGVVENDIKGKASCEVARACISGRGGGYGPIARILEEKAIRAQGIREAFEAGSSERVAILENLTHLLDDFKATLGNSELSLSDQRTELRRIDAQIGQTISELDNALPIGLLGAYANELERGAQSAGNADTTRVVNALLRDHGAALNAIISSNDEAQIAKPAFPADTGVSDTFLYIDRFIPIAAITFVVELVLPLTLWLYTFFILLYQIDPEGKRNKREVRREKWFDDIIDHDVATDTPSSIDPANSPQPYFPVSAHEKRRSNGRSGE